MTTANFSLVYYCGDRKTGTISVLHRTDGETRINRVGVGAESGLAAGLKPILVGLAENEDVVVLDPQTKALQFLNAFPADGFPAHVYSDPYSDRDWLMNDGDKATGNDQLNCGDKGSSVTVIDKSNSTQAQWLATICVGRGHHQATFTGPSEHAPDVPRRAVVSNLKDGTLSIVGNDPSDAQTDLKVLNTINLCEPEKEEGMEEATVPNNAFPHGLVYSPRTGKLYNLNNGYGTVAVIDPVSGEIEERFEFKGHSNLFVTPCGRYVIGRGADRKSDANHVFAQLTVYDLVEKKTVDQHRLQDVYFSKYYFNGDGSKLYLTTGSSGSPEQKANLKDDILLVFDLTSLPKISLSKELKIGKSGSIEMLNHEGKTQLVFSSAGASGELIVIDGQDEAIIETIQVNDGGSHSRVWLKV